MKPLLTVADASGLTPLQLPPELARQAGGNQGQNPSADAVSRFQAAMASSSVDDLRSLVGNFATPKVSDTRGALVPDTSEPVPLATVPDTSEPVPLATVSDTMVPDTSAPTASAAPLVSDTTPAVPVPTPPQVSDTTPAVPVPTPPQVSDTTPAVPVPIPPQVSDTTPAVPVPTPPQVSDTTPAMPAPTPSQVSDTTPAVSVPTPSQVSDTTPAVPVPTPPQVSDTTPAVSVPTPPQVSDTIPRASDTGIPSRVSVPNTPGPGVQKVPVAAIAVPPPRTSDKDREKTDGVGLVQAAPVALPAEMIRADVSPTPPAGAVTLEIDPASATARTQELVEAADAVAGAISVTPSLVKGEGEITIRLKPTVLDGSEIRIEAKGQTLTVSLNPASAEIQRLAEQSQASFASALAERIPSFQVSVFINPKSASRKNPVDETA